jgi:hypothetical protein
MRTLYAAPGVTRRLGEGLYTRQGHQVELTPGHRGGAAEIQKTDRYRRPES